MEQILKILKAFQHSELTKGELVLFFSMYNHRPMTIKDMAEMFDMKPRWIEEILPKLRKKGYVRSFIGSKYAISSKGSQYLFEINQKVYGVGEPL